MRRRTAASISRLETDTSNAGSLHGGRRRTQSGLSHSCERPTSISPAPSAQTISVALASNEIIRTLVIVDGLERVVHKRRRKDSSRTKVQRSAARKFRCHCERAADLNRGARSVGSLRGLNRICGLYRSAASAAPLELLRIDVVEAEQGVFVVRARSFADYVRSG